MQLKGKLVYLRPLQREDAQVSWRWRNDAEVWQFTFGRPDRTVSQEMEEQWMDKVLAAPSRLNFAICIKDSDQYIGNVYLTDITSETANFGIFIGEKSYWGRGIGTEATRILLAYAFYDLNINCVTLRVKAKNIGGRRAYENAGFVFKQQDGENILMIASNNSKNAKPIQL